MKALVAALERIATALEQLVPTLMQIHRELNTPRGEITLPDPEPTGSLNKFWVSSR